MLHKRILAIYQKTSYAMLHKVWVYLLPKSTALRPSINYSHLSLLANITALYAQVPHVKGSDHIAAQLSSEIEVLDGQTTPEGLFSLSTARCVGSCGIAPVVILDGTVRGKETPERMLKHVQTLLRNHTLGETE
jgi:hypothetical protein